MCREARVNEGDGESQILHKFAYDEEKLVSTADGIIL